MTNNTTQVTQTLAEFEALPFWRVFILAPSAGYWARGQTKEEAFAELRRAGYAKRTGITIWEFADMIRGQHFNGWGCGYTLHPSLPNTPEQYQKHYTRTEK